MYVLITITDLASLTITLNSVFLFLFALVEYKYRSSPRMHVYDSGIVHKMGDSLTAKLNCSTLSMAPKRKEFGKIAYF